MRNPDREDLFRFKRFEVLNRNSAMKVGTDGVLLGAWARGGLRILDIGTGSGVIALMMAQRFENADIAAVEIDEAASAEARENFRRSPWGERLSLYCGDFLSFASETSLRFDSIVSNPPFFNNGELPPEYARTTARHEGTLTLCALLDAASSLLLPGGIMSLVFPADRETELLSEARKFGLECSRLTRVTTVPRKPSRRVLVELTVGEPGAECVKDMLSIHAPDGTFTPRYTSLLHDFYLKF